jgi:glycosyltransferase involved in cell wall biosynthesis
MPVSEPARTDTPFTIAGQKPEKLAAPGTLQLPLVSFIVRNRNYGQYIGQAIDTLKAQDYPRIEVIIVDNASDDDSREIIDRHVQGDPRFRVIHADVNLGPLGGGLLGLEHATGEFVTFVDSDDTLLANFASAHVQVHLSNRLNVAFTSSSTLETNQTGTLFNGHRERSMIAKSGHAADLLDSDCVPRLSTIDDATYARLARSTTLISPRTSIWDWPWSPGTSNMYRRFMLDLVAPVCTDPETVQRLAADGHYNRLCHLLAGSAIIEVPLSTYRIHGNNFHVSQPSLHGMATNSGPAVRFAGLRFREIIRVLVARASEFSWRIGHVRYWDALGSLLNYPRHTDDVADKAGVPAFLATQLPELIQAFGAKTTLRELGKRLPARMLASAFRLYHRPGRLPIAIRLQLASAPALRLQTSIQRKLRKARGR